MSSERTDRVDAPLSPNGAPEFSQLVLRAVAVPLAALVVLAVALLAQLDRLAKLSAWVERSDAVVEHVYDADRTLLRAQSDWRARQLGISDQPDTYHTTRARLEQIMRELRHLVADNPEQLVRVRRLDELYQRHARCPEKAPGDVSATGGQTATEGLVAHIRCAQPLLASIVDVSRELLTAEERLRATRNAEARSAARVATWSGLALTAAVGLLLTFWSRRQLLNLGERYSSAVAQAHRQAEARSESEARLAGIINSAMDPIITVDGAQHIIVFNQAAEQVFGWKAEEVLGRPLDVLMPERFRAEHAADVARFGATGVTARSMGRPGAIRGLRKGGEEFPLEATISQVVVRGERLFTVILRDVTLRESIERALRDSEARLAGIINSAMDPIITVDESQRIVVFNRSAEQVFGWKPDELLGQPLDVLIPERFRSGHRFDVERFGAAGVTARSMGRPGAIRGLRKNGEEFPLEATISQVVVRGQRLFTVILRDITLREATERALRESEERFRLFMERVRDYAIFMIDASGRVISWNAETERITGYRAAEIVGQPFDLIFTESERAAGRPQEELVTAARDGAFQWEGERVRKDGTRYWAEVTTLALRDDQGALRGFAKLMRDITERKKTEEALRRHTEELETRVSERTSTLRDINAELNAFAYSVSHDLRAPLRSMQGFAEALLEDYADALDETGRDYARRVVNAARRMDALIQDLLTYSRLTRSDIELGPVDVGVLVRAVIAQNDYAVAGNGANIHVVEPLPAARAHRATLTQVLTNLIGNAVKFVPPGRKAEIRVQGQVDNGRVRFSVEDNGIGIAPEHQERIFRVFERLHPLEVYPGTGIGLAIVKKAVERMGGTVGVESTPGHGSCFWFELGAAATASSDELDDEP